MQWHNHINNWAETHLCSGDTNAFVIHSAAITRSLSLTLVASTALMKCPQGIWPHSRDGVLRCAKTHPCGNVMSAVILLCLYKRLASMIAEKKNKPYSKTIHALVEMSPQFLLLRSAVMCLRGSRSCLYHPAHSLAKSVDLACSGGFQYIIKQFRNYLITTTFV